MSKAVNPPFLLFSGTSHPEFAYELAKHLGVSLGHVLFRPFPDNELYVQIQDNVRGRDIFLVQSIAHEPNHYLMEMLIVIDALKRASAKSIAAVIPYFGYARQDRKDQPRVPITAKLVANLLTTAGATRVLTMDLHAGQIQGFFDIPVDNLVALPSLAHALKKLELENTVVMAPDLGAIKIARAYATYLKNEFVLIDKRRVSSEKVEAAAIIGDVAEKNVVIVDDMISTGGTIVMAAEACKSAGAKKIYVAATHGLFVNEAIPKLEESEIEKIFVANTVPLPKEFHRNKIVQVSVANLFSEAIHCILSAESLSSIYNHAF